MNTTRRGFLVALLAGLAAMIVPASWWGVKQTAPGFSSDLYLGRVGFWVDKNGLTHRVLYGGTVHGGWAFFSAINAEHPPPLGFVRTIVECRPDGNWSVEDREVPNA